MAKYWMSVIVSKDGQKIDVVAGHNLEAASEADAKKLAKEYARGHYPGPEFKLRAQVGLQNN